VLTSIYKCTKMRVLIKEMAPAVARHPEARLTDWRIYEHHQCTR
jgi:hypothetical protein